MKNLYFIVFSVLLIFGCESKLDIAPKGYETNASFYKSSGDANAAIIACYSALRSVYGGHSEYVLVPNSIMADDAIPFLTGGADRIQSWNYTFNPNNFYFRDIWTTAYKGILFSNIALGEIPNIEIEPELKMQYLGEAKFLRALHYFNLVRYFGEVPLVTGKVNNLDSVFVEKASTERILNLIEEDLKFAEQNLPIEYSGAEKGRASKIAAKGVLAKFYLTLAGNDENSTNWQKAASKAKEIIDIGNNDLWDNYYQVFSLESRGGKESIFEILFNRDYAHNLFTGYAPRGAPIVPAGGYGISRVTKSLFDSYSDLDKRKDVSFLTYYIHPTTKDTVKLSIDDPDASIAISFWKLADSSATAGTNTAQTSFPYLRYSDILLILAESINEANGGPNLDSYSALNKVRVRAGLDPVDNLTKEEFRDSVLLERRRELCFEGHRWFDLQRRGRLITAVKAENSFNRNASIDEHHNFLPIPESELDANPKLSQNAGY